MKQILRMFAFYVLLQAATVHAQDPTTVDASRGGVTVSSGVNSVTLGARIQFRWTAIDREAFDADLVGTGVGVEDPFLSLFDVPRMRVALGGGMFRPWLRY